MCVPLPAQLPLPACKCPSHTTVHKLPKGVWEGVAHCRSSLHVCLLFGHCCCPQGAPSPLLPSATKSVLSMAHKARDLLQKQGAIEQAVQDR
jgi:hypothetical protein